MAIYFCFSSSVPIKIYYFKNKHPKLKDFPDFSLSPRTFPHSRKETLQTSLNVNICLDVCLRVSLSSTLLSPVFGA